MRLTIRHLAGAALAALSLAACATAPAPQAAAPEAPAFDYADFASVVLALPQRMDADREHDQRRKAAETLAFMQVRPHQTVFDIESGGGYWTEILSHAVGEHGEVYTQNPAGFIPFIQEQMGRRYANDRLSNVRRTITAFDILEANDASIDVVTWVQGPHELFYHPDNGDNLGDPAAAYAEIHRILKPGGAFVVVDHAAIPGAPESSGNDLHRIDPAIVIRMAEAAGFRLEARGDFLANPADAHTLNVFDPAIRGHTDQFALRFRKPA